MEGLIVSSELEANGTVSRFNVGREEIGARELMGSFVSASV